MRATAAAGVDQGKEQAGVEHGGHMAGVLKGGKGRNPGQEEGRKCVGKWMPTWMWLVSECGG